MKAFLFCLSPLVRGGLGVALIILLPGCAGSPPWGNWSHTPVKSGPSFAPAHHTPSPLVSSFAASKR